MGVTVLYSTGDNGVAAGGYTCLFPNGTESSSPEAKIFSPTFPSMFRSKYCCYMLSASFPAGTCPYITGVGATQVAAGQTVWISFLVHSQQVITHPTHLPQISDPETAVYEQIFTAGGFSNFFAMPEYQKSAVQNFLTNHPPPYPADIWNSTGRSRAYPDISLNG